MLADVARDDAIRWRRFDNELRHTIETDAIPYMDDLAQQIGCFPPLGALLLKIDKKYKYKKIYIV